MSWGGDGTVASCALSPGGGGGIAARARPGPSEEPSRTRASASACGGRPARCVPGSGGHAIPGCTVDGLASPSPGNESAGKDGWGTGPAGGGSARRDAFDGGLSHGVPAGGPNSGAGQGSRRVRSVSVPAEPPLALRWPQFPQNPFSACSAKPHPRHVRAIFPPCSGLLADDSRPLRVNGEYKNDYSRTLAGDREGPGGDAEGYPGALPGLPRGGADDAGARGGTGGQPLGGDGPPAPLAPPVTALPEPVQRLIQLGQVAVRLVEQSGQLGPLERDRGTLGIMLVVSGDPCGRLHDAVELPPERGDPGQGVLLLGVQRIPDGRRRAGRHATGHPSEHAGPSLRRLTSTPDQSLACSGSPCPRSARGVAAWTAPAGRCSPPQTAPAISRPH